jgi:hypothetical protein
MQEDISALRLQEADANSANFALRAQNASLEKVKHLGVIACDMINALRRLPLIDAA